MELLIDNQLIAVYNKINELSSRWNLTPMDFVATLRDLPSDSIAIRLDFDCAPKDSIKHERFTRMLNLLGINSQDWSISGDINDIYANLCYAIQKSPMQSAFRQ